MTVRPATEADVPALLAMGRRFIESSTYRDLMPVVPERQADVIATLLQQGGCWVLESPDGGCPVGMLGVVLAPLPLTGELAGLEAMWWVEPMHRGGRGAMRMWREAEAWARAQGARCMQMLQPVDQLALAPIYARHGYTPVETSWFKRFAA